MEKRFKEKTGIDFNTFYKNNRTKLIWFLFSKTNKDYDIEGIVDIAFVKLLNTIDRYDSSIGELETLLYTIAYNDLKLTFKQDRIETCIIDTHIFNLTDYDKNDEDSIEERFNALKTYVNGFDKKTQDVFYLRYEGKSLKEIAEILDMNLSTVKTKLHVLKKKTKK